MNFKRLLFLICLATGLFLTGCSNSEAISISDNSKVVLIPDGEGGKALTLATIVDNNTNEKSVPFYVEIDIQDEWLSSKLEEDKFIAGESIAVNKPGDLYTVEAHSKYQTGHTLRVVEEDIEEDKLKQTIEQQDAVKVNLLNEKEEVIQSGLIRNYDKDFTNEMPG